MKVSADKVFLGVLVSGFLLSFSLVAIVMYNANLKQREEDAFSAKCAAACFPNAVYSTEHKRCMCNAIVTVREIK
jgi:TRAP-type C4-dicarboxylate transport system permease large subunit